MFERFTENSVKVIMLAQEEARGLGSNRVGTEHILLGLTAERLGGAGVTLSSMGVNIEEVRAQIEKLMERSSAPLVGEIPFTLHTKRALELAWQNARDQNANYIDTEHLLLGVLVQKEGKALQVLSALEIDLDELRSRLLEYQS